MTIPNRDSRKIDFRTAFAAHRAGEFETARRGYESLIRANKRDFRATHLLGVLLAQEQRVGDALPLLRRAVQLDPTSAEAQYNLGVAEALAGAPEAARKAYKKALVLDPEHLNARFNLACLLIAAKDFEGAETQLRRVLERDPAFPGALRNLGSTLKELRRYQDSLSAYREAMKATPNDAQLMSDISGTLNDMNLPAEAEKWARVALKFAPNLPSAHNNLGVARTRWNDMDGALEHFRQACEAAPDNTSALLNRAHLLMRLSREIDLAGELARKVLAIDPDNPKASIVIGSLQANNGDYEGGLDTFERCLPLLNPSDRNDCRTMYLFLLSHSATRSPEQVAAAHIECGAQILAERSALVRDPQDFPNERDPQRPLRIGFVSGDFRNHPVLHFLEPTLLGLDRSQFIPVAYSTLGEADSVTDWAKTLFAGWRDVADFSEEELRQQIMADSIDILFDLAGHTALNRLGTFAMRAAPVQASWIGNPNTTGLAAMDYYLSDRFLTPPGSDELFSEKLIRLPIHAGFAPYPELPPVAEPPCLAKGHVTFGTFNRRLKMTPQVLDVWAATLNAVPSSRLVFAAISRDKEIQNLRAEFSARGVEPERLDFLEKVPTGEYMRRHADIDLVLDTFPFSGGTVTRHSLWMGVPTITCRGRAPQQNQSAAILSSIGLDEFIVTEPDAMLSRAVELAGNPERLRDLRLGMRERLESSIQRDMPALGTAFGEALRGMWGRWCRGAVPEAFEVRAG